MELSKGVCSLYSMKSKIAIVVGTRPEAIKLIPVYLKMQESTSLQPVLISTGQHKEMLDEVFTFFEVQPDIELEVMLQKQTLIQLTSRILDKLGQHISGNTYKAVIVQGDTTTAFIAGLTAYYHQIPVGHVEAGLRTYDNYSPFPEEVNRKLIGTFAQFNFAPTPKAVEALKKENISNIHMVGNTVVDSLLLCYDKVKQKETLYEEMFSLLCSKNKLALITGHRRESFGDGFQQICGAIREIAERYTDMNFIYPVHLNPNVQDVVYKELSGISNVYLISPLPYNNLIYLMSKVDIILTDSGGIQEEAPTFNVPIVVMRNKTERQEGIDAGCAVLAGTTQAGIVKHFTKIMDDKDLYIQMTKAENPYGNGTASQQIVSILEKFFNMELAEKTMETYRKFLRELKTNALYRASWDYSGWKTNIDPEYTKHEWKQTLYTAINRCSANISKLTLSGGANFIVIPVEMSKSILNLMAFEVNIEDNLSTFLGMRQCGTLGGRYRVFIDHFSRGSEILIGRMSNDIFEEQDPKYFGLLKITNIPTFDTTHL